MARHKKIERRRELERRRRRRRKRLKLRAKGLLPPAHGQAQPQVQGNSEESVTPEEESQ